MSIYSQPFLNPLAQLASKLCNIKRNFTPSILSKTTTITRNYKKNALFEEKKRGFIAHYVVVVLHELKLSAL